MGASVAGSSGEGEGRGTEDRGQRTVDRRTGGQEGPAWTTKAESTKTTGSRGWDGWIRSMRLTVLSEARSRLFSQTARPQILATPYEAKTSGEGISTSHSPDAHFLESSPRGRHNHFDLA
jgi:hypothetical protein